MLIQPCSDTKICYRGEIIIYLHLVIKVILTPLTVNLTMSGVSIWPLETSSSQLDPISTILLALVTWLQERYGKLAIQSCNRKGRNLGYIEKESTSKS